MWKSVLSQFNRYTNHVLKNVGGRYINNMPGQKPYEVAPAQKGRDAVNYLSRQLFDAPVWLYPSTIRFTRINLRLVLIKSRTI